MFEETASGNGEASVPPSFSTIQLSEEDFRRFLLDLSKQTGCVAELARRLDVSGQFLGDVIAGRKRAGAKLLDKLGAQVRRTYTVYVEKQEQ